jgi:anti-sigma factor ChrR (cupin superfamily)
MELNADFAQRAVVHAASLAWVASPVAGVERRMLDRIGDEVARATSIVRYAPNSRFPAHTHGGGEEFLVLEGVFEDEHGEFPAGSYIRNPPTSRHTPGSVPGCVIFVKLWQFDPADRTELRLDTRDLTFVPAPGRNGVEVLPLFRRPREEVRIERWTANAAVALDLPGGAEFFVLDGGFMEAGDRLTRQSWLRLPPGSALAATADPEGCKVWVKTGHLLRIEGTTPR